MVITKWSQKGELTRWEGAACGLDCLLAAHLPTNEDIADGWKINSNPVSNSCPPDLVVCNRDLEYVVFLSFFLYFYITTFQFTSIPSIVALFLHTPSVECSPNDRPYSLFFCAINRFIHILQHSYHSAS